MLVIRSLRGPSMLMFHSELVPVAPSTLHTAQDFPPDADGSGSRRRSTRVTLTRRETRLPRGGNFHSARREYQGCAVV